MMAHFDEQFELNCIKAHNFDQLYGHTGFGPEPVTYHWIGLIGLQKYYVN